MTSGWKPKPETGPDCLMCAKFAGGALGLGPLPGCRREGPHPRAEHAQWTPAQSHVSPEDSKEIS